MQKLLIFIAAFFITIAGFAQEKDSSKKQHMYTFKLDTAALSKFYKQQGEAYAAVKKKNTLPKTKPVQIPLVVIAKTGIVPMPNAYNKQSDSSVPMPNAYVTSKLKRNLVNNTTAGNGRFS